MLLTTGRRPGIRIPAQVPWTRSELPDAKAKGPTRKRAGPLTCAPVDRRNRKEAPSARTRSPRNVFRRILLTPLRPFRPKAFQSTQCPIRRPFNVQAHCRAGPDRVQAKRANGVQFLVDKSRYYPLFIHWFIHTRRRPADRARTLEAIDDAGPAGTGAVDRPPPRRRRYLAITSRGMWLTRSAAPSVTMTVSPMHMLRPASPSNRAMWVKKTMPASMTWGLSA